MKKLFKLVIAILMIATLLFVATACAEEKTKTIKGACSIDAVKDVGGKKKTFTVNLIITVTDTKVVEVKIDKSKDCVVTSDNYYDLKFEAGINDLLRQFKNKPFSFFKDFYLPTQYTGGLNGDDIYKKKLTVITGASFSASFVAYAVRTILAENSLV